MKTQTVGHIPEKYTAPRMQSVEIESQYLLATSGTTNEPFVEEEEMFDWSTGNVKPINLLEP
ncbi:MAG: hypothetical protein IKP63_03070 [Paludibacteraceae bacterium]|nr:hypothetical protein [Paludibacteraceae bacterium]MBR6286764.1 hypothetical protein [Bacteroidaceae bacterium]